MTIEQANELIAPYVGQTIAYMTITGLYTEGSDKSGPWVRVLYQGRQKVANLKRLLDGFYDGQPDTRR